MIKEFNNVECRESAIIYQSNFEQIKKLFAQDPQMAGELAIALCEVALTGQHSSDNYIVDIMLENFKVVSSKNKTKYDKTLDVKRQKKILDQQLDKIADLLDKGLTQTKIAAKLGTTKQTINNRVKLIRAEFPELLSSKNCLTLDKNDNELSSKDTEVKLEMLDEKCEMLDVSSAVKRVKCVKSNDNVNDNDNIEMFASQTFPVISLDELNHMGVSYEWIKEGMVKINGTGKICKIL